ncbi:hypothetical protein INP82_16360 [Citrobacter sedlakii]|uniref:hypothetical protein n=1 Tax=Citrobacter TaxID=544 RepID=UPI001969ABAD|nr:MULTISPECIES: hypothetical protein [Citrobacter]MBM9568984.1 hypothetical protein [Citrobacter sedlakii]HBL4691948.1 hypothetical protein [Citrobacter sedlakii]HBL4706183.1 hypothetical protein [Citrobacter sedlakii]HBL4720836.1 hypothetical protein [Citrobacter sedlakii]HCA7841786.1 hypothetical protein [Citrobacter sedlakii]
MKKPHGGGYYSIFPADFTENLIGIITILFTEGFPPTPVLRKEFNNTHQFVFHIFSRQKIAAHIERQDYQGMILQ